MNQSLFHVASHHLFSHAPGRRDDRGSIKAETGVLLRRQNSLYMRVRLTIPGQVPQHIIGHCLLGPKLPAGENGRLKALFCAGLRAPNRRRSCRVRAGLLRQTCGRFCSATRLFPGRWSIRPFGGVETRSASGRVADLPSAAKLHSGRP